MILTKLQLNFFDGTSYVVVPEFENDVAEWIHQFDMRQVKSFETTETMTPFEWEQHRSRLICLKRL